MSEQALPRFPKRSGKRKSSTKSAGSPLDGRVRVATYTRISTDEVNQPYSLEAQAEHLSRFLAMRPDWTLAREFTDQTTGSKLERPGLQKLLAAVRAGQIDAILVYRVDRFSRSLRHLQELIQVL